MNPKEVGRDEVPQGPLTGLQAGAGAPLCASITLTSSRPVPRHREGPTAIPSWLLLSCPRPSSLLAGPAPHNPTQRGASQHVTWLQEALAALPENSVPHAALTFQLGTPRAGSSGRTSDARVSAARDEAWDAWAFWEMRGRKGKMREEGRKMRHAVSLGKDGPSRTAQQSLRAWPQAPAV